VDVGAARGHIISDLGLAVQAAGHGLLGAAEIVPELHVPGTGCLRTSILATWTDVLAGLLVARALAPRVPVTLELDVHLHRPARGLARVEAAAQTLKVGRSVAVASVTFTGDGEPLAVGAASFMASPDTSLTIEDPTADLTMHHLGRGRLTVPFAERAGCVRTGVGVAELPRSDQGLNSSNTINGGLIALAVEEAALSTTGGTLASLAMRYLRPARVGPVVATATAHGPLAQVDVRDAGSDDKLAVVATARRF
jgi:acyl-coenzyme A thioesterase PaaI-like protein